MNKLTTVKMAVVSGLRDIQRMHSDILNIQCDGSVSISEATRIGNSVIRQFNSNMRLIRELDPIDTLGDK